MCGMQLAEASAAAKVEYNGKRGVQDRLREESGEVRVEVSAVYSCAAGSAGFFSRCSPNFSMRYTSVLRVMFRKAAARV